MTKKVDALYADFEIGDLVRQTSTDKITFLERDYDGRVFEIGSRSGSLRRSISVSRGDFGIIAPPGRNYSNDVNVKMSGNEIGLVYIRGVFVAFKLREWEKV